MRYIGAGWKHDFNNEPTRLVSEVGPDDYETENWNSFLMALLGMLSNQ